MFEKKSDGKIAKPLAIKGITTIGESANGRVLVPIMLYILGVPGVFVIILWALFFRGN